MGWLQDIASSTQSKQQPVKTASTRNNDAQPINSKFRAHAVGERQVDELIGLVKGILADGVVYQTEAEFLLNWFNANNAIVDQWPAKAIYPRLLHALQDGHLDADEEAEIMALLLATVGGNRAPAHGFSSDSSSLPLNNPVPEIVFPGRRFCFTGKFTSGSRGWCEEQVAALGAEAASSVTKKLDYLVIGEIGSRDWLHSTHGTKIKKAIELRDGGLPLFIVSEQTWFDYVTR